MKKIILIGIFIFTLSFSIIHSKENLKIGTIERPPMSFKNLNNEWEGFSVELWKEIAQEVGFKYEWVEFKKFPQMIKAVANKNVDLAIANITISANREEKMDFSQPIFDSGLQIMINQEKNLQNIWQAIIKSGVLWFILGALILLLIIAHILWFFERGTKSARHDYFRDDYLGGVWDAFWWAFIIMTMGGFENEVPASKFSRFLAMMWIIISLFFVSALTAQITTSLTMSGLNSNITSLQDLSGKKVGIIKSEPINSYLKKELNQEPIIYLNYEKMYQDLKNKKIEAIVGDAPILKYYVATQGKNDFELVGGIFKPEKYGILLPENSPWKEKIDQAILKIQEDGRYQKIYKKYFK